MTTPQQPEGREEIQGLDLLDDVSDEVGTHVRRGPARWLFVLAAVVVVVLAIVGITSLTHRSGSGANQAAETVASEVRSAKDVKTLHADGKPSGTVNLSYSRSSDSYAVQLQDVPAVASGNEYQVAVTTATTDQRFVIVGLLGPDPGDTWFGYRGLKDVVSVHVTEVVQGGEEAPDHDDLVDIELPAS